MATSLKETESLLDSGTWCAWSTLSHATLAMRLFLAKLHTLASCSHSKLAHAVCSGILGTCTSELTLLLLSFPTTSQDSCKADLILMTFSSVFTLVLRHSLASKGGEVIILQSLHTKSITFVQLLQFLTPDYRGQPHVSMCCPSLPPSSICASSSMSQAASCRMARVRQPV